MDFLFLVSILCIIYGFADIDNLNRSLEPFLTIEDSIKSVEDGLYRFFNLDIADIRLSSKNGENHLTIKFYNTKNNLLPKCLERLVNVHAIYLQGNNLTLLPEYFSKFTSLYLLELSSNNFNRLPPVLFSLKSLVYLYLNDNKFEHIKDDIGKLKQLKILNFSKNNIKSVSKNFRELKELQYLNLSYNLQIIRAGYLDNDIKKDINFWKIIPSSIQSLHLDKIGLRYIPYTFNLPRLSIVTLSHNLLDYLPISFGECVDISTFDVSFNNLIIIPSFIYQLPKLKILKLNSNQIESTFYIRKHMLPMLKELDLTACDIKKFKVEGYDNDIYYNSSINKYIRYNPQPANLLKSLNYLSLTADNSTPGIINSLERLLITITKTSIVPNLLVFPNLLSLKIATSDTDSIDPKRIRYFFYDLQNIKFLNDLELIGFNLIIIPKEIFTLKNLQSLLLCLCKIKKIPNEIASLSNLKKIDLSYNNIETINPKIFELDTLKNILLCNNPVKYLPSEINNNNLIFKLKINGDNLEFFKKDNDNLSLIDLSYKKVTQIHGCGSFFNRFSASMKELYDKSHEEAYEWELDQLLKIKDKRIKKSTKDYDIIMSYWNTLKHHIMDNNIKNKFYNYVQSLFSVQIGRDEKTENLVENIKDNIKNYVGIIFEILTALVVKGNTEIVETIIVAIEPGLSVCVDGQLQHFSYAYHLLIGDYNESTTIEYFIKNRIAGLKYDALREITTSNNEKQNIHIFLHWQRELSIKLGLPFFQQQHEINTKITFLKSEEYILYQFFKLMSVKNVVKDIFESINKTNSTITMASQYIYNSNDDIEKLKEYVEYEGDIDYLKITSITEQGVYFILEEMGLIKKTANKNI